ncbi:hypothetical protein K2173_024670 [Erythroxylum novogranatense]|uniref:Receptor-like serine/threonine-protein kinase n=1 Tax=Erythroxylum novogranatense TaxID=1862640 RepID=A0AAV8SW32_9ROSI|nr:hypothetical protein K2173_024670 [Erythroxylum novogranatense]
MDWSRQNCSAMEIMRLFHFGVCCLCLLLMLKTCAAGPPHQGLIYPGFEISQMESVGNRGFFLLSKNSTFGFGFYTGLDVNLFVLVVEHITSAKVVWSANRGHLVGRSDKFVFDETGNAYLQRGNGLAWSSYTGGQRATSMELRESGNLVLLGDNEKVLWQSFSHPTDTLLPSQEFGEGMKLQSFPNKNKLLNFLAIKSGDLVLYGGYRTPQVYWSLRNDSRKTNDSVGGSVYSALVVSNSWNFYDERKVLLWQFIIDKNSDQNATWAVVLGSNGAIGFYDLQNGREGTTAANRIPQDSCRVPEPCDPYYVCYFDNWCQCPPLLNSQFGCRPPVASACNSSTASSELLYVGERLDYFALKFATPLSESNLNSCIEACRRNCSCVVLFFHEGTRGCFLFDQLGSFTRSQEGSSGYSSYIKVSSGALSFRSRKTERKQVWLTVMIVATTTVVIAGLVYLGFWFHRRKTKLVEFPEENLENDSFLDGLSGMPVRYSFSDLCTATKNFTMKIGQGGFGSVYLGTLQDGTQLAVKKLEGVGQGTKEFRAEVSIIGRIHHVHLVKLKGFCAEGSHRLLVYEYMRKGSLDKWLFKNNEASVLLDWNTRYNIALGTAKGLAYLHEECESKIVHCDIKPQNVLLDDNFAAKVSDFGLAKLMSRDDSLVYTTVRGTRGYLAPEWITNHPISEKTDVYSYGIVLLEIIGGRRNYSTEEDSENFHFPSYSFKKFEEGKLEEIADPKLGMDGNEQTVVSLIKVALWCIQDDKYMRPPMSKVVQMLEGICAVPEPPTPSQSAGRTYSFLRWNVKDCSTSDLTDLNTDTSLSNVEEQGSR